MKRSEMLAAIRQELEGKPIQYDYAEEILSVVEKLGMKPPSISEDKCQALMSVYYGGYTFNQWDEDFEKDVKAVEALKRREEAQTRRKK